MVNVVGAGGGGGGRWAGLMLHVWSTASRGRQGSWTPNHIVYSTG